MNNPLVSIIITNYNYGHYLIGAIESCINQTYKNIEIIVVDDGSTDNSWENLKLKYKPNSETINEEYRSFRLHGAFSCYHIKNSGASNARNFGISKVSAKAKYISILDADDEYSPDRIDTLIQKLEEYDELGVAYSDYIIERPDYSTCEFKYPYSGAELTKHCIVHSAGLIKRKYLEIIKEKDGSYYDKKLHGPLSSGFIGCTEDYDLWLRLASHCVMVHVPRFLCKVREHGNNQSLKMTGDVFENNMRLINAKKN